MPVRRREPEAEGTAVSTLRQLRSLLRTGLRPGYPAEYLCSRVRGRRSKLVRDWRAVLHDPSPALHLASPQYEGFVRERSLEGMRAALQREHVWVFGQMDENLRRDLAPYFLYGELRTLFLCLRFRAAEREQEAAAVLQDSLLSRDMRDLLRSAPIPVLYRDLERRFRPVAPAVRGLADRYAAGEQRTAERLLTGACLGAVLSLPLHPALRGLFTRLIDARNLLSLYKAGRFGARDSSMFLPGGSIPPGRLAAALEREDPFAILPFVKLASGSALQEPDTTALETALYRSITKYLRREGREPLGTAVVLDYLWRCSLEITNLAILFAGRDLDREASAAELVY